MTLRIYETTAVTPPSDIRSLLHVDSAGQYRTWVTATSKTHAGELLGDAFQTGRPAVPAAFRLAPMQAPRLQTLKHTGLLFLPGDIVVTDYNERGGIVHLSPTPGMDPELVGEWTFRQDDDEITQTVIRVHGVDYPVPVNDALRKATLHSREEQARLAHEDNLSTVIQAANNRDPVALHKALNAFTASELETLERTARLIGLYVSVRQADRTQGEDE